MNTVPVHLCHQGGRLGILSLLGSQFKSPNYWMLIGILLLNVWTLKIYELGISVKIVIQNAFCKIYCMLFESYHVSMSEHKIQEYKLRIWGHFAYVGNFFAIFHHLWIWERKKKGGMFSPFKHFSLTSWQFVINFCV